GADAIERGFPPDAAEVRFAFGPRDGERQPPRVLEPHGGPGLEVANGVLAKEGLGDRLLHVAGLRLDRLLADLGEVSLLVDHPPVLPAHPQGARLARIPRAEP